jgi:hypothetical protein
VAYEFPIRQLQREFSMTTEARLNELRRIASELHDTLLQSVEGLMFSFRAARNLLPGRTEEAIRTLDGPSARETRPAPRAGMRFKACAPTRPWRAT